MVRIIGYLIIFLFGLSIFIYGIFQFVKGSLNWGDLHKNIYYKMTDYLFKLILYLTNVNLFLCFNEKKNFVFTKKWYEKFKEI